MKDKLEKLFNNRCAYCGLYTRIEYVEVEHFVPKFIQPVCRDDNYLPACRQCNMVKGTYLFCNVKTAIIYVHKIYALMNKQTNPDRLTAALEMPDPLPTASAQRQLLLIMQREKIIASRQQAQVLQISEEQLNEIMNKPLPPDIFTSASK